MGIFSYFVNPAFLGFLGLISAPVIIYLINRQRYRRRKWAAMEFLLKALKKNQRRLQLQNLLLLLIRVLIILFIVLAVTRPVLRENSFGVTSGTRQNWVLVLDTSFSMNYNIAGRSLFNQARITLSQMVEELLNPGDTVALATLAHDPQVLMGKSGVSPDVRKRIQRELEDLRLSYRPVRLLPSLRLLEDVVADIRDPAGQPESCRIVLFSDLQRRDWLDEGGSGEGGSGEGGPMSPEIGEILDRLGKRGAEISVARLAAETKKLNVAIRDVSIKPKLVARDVPVTLSVTVENLSDRDAENLDLTLRIENGSEIDPDAEDSNDAQLGEVLRIPARGSVTRTLPYRFDAAGHFTVVAEIRSDDLVVDNRRSLVIAVQDDVNVLLVDGDPGFELESRETFFLEFALQPKDDDLGTLGGRFTPFLPQYATAESLDSVDWEDFSVVILANVEELSVSALKGLERFVAEGGALLVYLGDNIRPDFYNEQMYKAGKGLLPVELDAKRGDRQTPVQLQFVSSGHPVARYFEEQKARSYLYGGVVAFYEYYKVGALPADGGVEVLCRFNDLDRNPAIFDNAFGRGRVMWVMSSANRAWNELAAWQDYIVFLYESISYLMGFGTRSLNLGVGEEFQQIYSADEFASEVLLRVPTDDSDLGGSRTLRRSMREVEGEGRFAVSYDDTSTPGLYRLDFKRPRTERGDSVEYFSVNVDAREGELKGMTVDDFQEHFNISPQVFDASQKFRDLDRQKEMLRGSEYWRQCLFAVLLLLILETALAQFFGRKVR